MAMSTVLQALGAVTAVAIAGTIIDTIIPYLRSSQLHRFVHTKNGPPWALVTGASVGIGAAFCRELAATGFNVILHGRNPTKLERVQHELQAAFPDRQFRTLVADCTDCSPAVFSTIVSQLGNINLTLLVNNAGGLPPSVGDNNFKPVQDYTPTELSDVISINGTFPTLLTSSLLPLLIKNSPALVMTVGSLADNGLPLVASYGATKSYLAVFAQALNREMHMEGHDVQVLHLRLGSVTGVAHTWTEPGFFLPHASDLVKVSLRAIGCGRTVVVPWWGHKLQAVAVDWMGRASDAMFEGEMKKLKAGGLNYREKKE
ncbi:hypothetical protein OQA88_12674 [Cercophora sp. LCS_1]